MVIKVKIIVCIDPRMGYFFNNRRQTKDKIIRKHLLETYGPLYISEYSSDMFKEDGDYKIVSSLDNDGWNLIEDMEIPDRVDEILLVRWNKRYPADRYLTIDLSQYQMIDRYMMNGNSHEDVVVEHYAK